MTDTETIEAILKDLTAENQLQLLLILADALSDAGLDKQETALRYALREGKRPYIWNDNDDITDEAGLLEGAVAHWRPDTWGEKHLLYSTLPTVFIEQLLDDKVHRDAIGRYYRSLTTAWRSFLDGAESYLELLLREVNS